MHEIDVTIIGERGKTDYNTRCLVPIIPSVGDTVSLLGFGISKYGKARVISRDIPCFEEGKFDPMKANVYIRLKLL